jgi:NitT/TauT family transport system substrate-binding protein
VSASKRRLFVVSSVLLLAILGITYFLHRSRNSSRRELTIAQYGDVFLYAPLYVAKDAGFFSSRGLTVSIVSTGGDEKTWAAVTSGSAAFGVADPTFVAISDARGQPGRVIAAIVNGVPFWGITFKRDLGPIVHPSDLDHYTVATFPSPSTAYTLQREMFVKAGLPPKIREGAIGTLLPMIRNGQADIALELEPNVSGAVRDGAHVVYAMSDVYGDFAMTGLTATPDYLAAHQDVAQDVVCSLQMADDYIRLHREESLDILSKRFPEINRDVAAAALERMVNGGTVPQSVVVSSTAWDNAIQLRVASGDLKAPNAEDSFLDNSFSKWADANCHSK